MRFVLTISLLFVVLILSVTPAISNPVFFPRRPGISPDGQTLAFSFQGDLWTVSAAGGRAERITVHSGYDRDPVFSPDGSVIVFASDRYDQYDLFTIPVKGGIPLRLTYAPTTDLPLDWSIDSRDCLLYTSPSPRD